MTPSIAALPPSAHIRDPDTETPVTGNEHGAHEPAKFWSSDEGASFGEVLDAVNPLHHIPVVSAIYRAVSGDEIGLGPRLIGAAIFGGPLGVILAGISLLFEEASGGNVAEHAVALFEDVTGGGGREPADVVATLLDHAEGDASEGTQPSAVAHVEVAELAKTPTTPSPIIEPPIAASRADQSEPAANATSVPSPSAGSVLSPGVQVIITESKRAAQTALQSQRGQADLLLANVRAHELVMPRHDDGEESGDDEDRGPHSNLPPAGATSAWYADAMQRALDKYRTDHGGPAGGP